MKQNTLESILESVVMCEHGMGCNKCCWLWKGQVSKKGYGKVSYLNDKHIAHSLIFKLHHSLALYTGECCLHTCDIPLCCNWNHIYIGDTKQNVQDKVERNRQIKGVQSSQSVVNDNKVLQLRRLYSSGGWTQADLCYVFGVSTTIVNRIINRKDWTHVQGEILV